MRDKSTAKVNITLRIAAVMLVLVLISASMISGMYARFTTTAYGEDSARVAKWDVNVTNTSTSKTFNESGSVATAEELTYNFTVTNNSEVSMEYSVKVSFDTAPPANVSLILDGEEITCNGGKEYIFNPRTYNVGETAKAHTLTVQVQYVTEDGKLIEFDSFTGKAEISIIAEQVD